MNPILDRAGRALAAAWRRRALRLALVMGAGVLALSGCHYYYGDPYYGPSYDAPYHYGPPVYVAPSIVIGPGYRRGYRHGYRRWSR